MNPVDLIWWGLSAGIAVGVFCLPASLGVHFLLTGIAAARRPSRREEKP